MALLNLFTSNFKKLKTAAGIAAAVALFFLIGHALRYFYVEEQEWERKLWHDFYALEENIDVLYLGSSHVFYDINPNTLTSESGEKHFSLATSLQSLKESYYLLKEADKYNDLSRVYLEISYGVSTGSYGSLGDGAGKNSWKNTDYMKWSFNKIAMMKDMNRKEYYLDALFPYIRYRGYLTDMEYVKERIAQKTGEAYKHYQHDTVRTENGVAVGERYETGGYCHSELEMTRFQLSKWGDTMRITEESEIYLKRIIAYCQERGIEIVLFSSPLYELEIISLEDYDGYSRQIHEIADTCGVLFYDFNLAKEEVLPIQSREYFRDYTHLNAKGSKLFTGVFYQTVCAETEGMTDAFYGSHAEKMREYSPNVYGLYYEKMIEDGQEIYAVSIASNREQELEYRIILIEKQDEETTVLQDFSSNKGFHLPPEWEGTCLIIWRETGKTEIEMLDVLFE